MVEDLHEHDGNSVIRVTSKTVDTILEKLENLRWLRSLDFTHCYKIHEEKLNELSRKRRWLKVSTNMLDE